MDYNYNIFEIALDTSWTEYNIQGNVVSLQRIISTTCACNPTTDYVELRPDFASKDTIRLYEGQSVNIRFSKLYIRAKDTGYRVLIAVSKDINISFSNFHVAYPTIVLFADWITNRQTIVAPVVGNTYTLSVTTPSGSGYISTRYLKIKNISIEAFEIQQTTGQTITNLNFMETWKLENCNIMGNITATLLVPEIIIKALSTDDIVYEIEIGFDASRANV